MMKLSNKPVKFSLILISVFIMLVSGFAGFGLERLKNSREDNIRHTLETILNSNHKAIYIWINQRKLDIADLTKNSEFVNLVSNLIYEHQSRIKPLYVSTVAEIKKHLHSEIEKNRQVDFFIISRDRRTVASTRDETTGEISPVHMQRKKALDRVFFSGETVFINVMGEDKTYCYYIVSPIKNYLGVPFAAIIIEIDPNDEFSNITRLGRLGESGDTYAFNKNGELITEIRHAQYQQQAGKQSFRLVNPGFKINANRLSELSTDQLPLTLMVESATSGNTSNDVNGYRDYRGVFVFGAWLWDKELGIGLATEIDMSEGMQSYYEIKNTVLIILTFTVLLSLLLFVFIQVLHNKSERILKNAQVKLEQRVTERTKELQEAKDKLTIVNKELEKLSTTDSLTGISNRRHFDAHFNNEWKHCVREKKSVTIIMFDIDCFKKYNDTYGHQKGDECLVAIGQMLKTINLANRPGDMVARYGGEEFVVLLIGASHEYAEDIANKIHKGMMDLNILHETSDVDNYQIVTTSVGFAREQAPSKNGQHGLIKCADEALYEAKGRGRNRVVEYGSVEVVKH